MDNHRSVMDRRIGLMAHILVYLMAGTSRIGMILSGMVGSWIHMIEEVVDMGSTLVLVRKGIMVIIAIILIGGVTWDHFWMS